MTEACICDAVRTPIGRYGGALAHVRADDLAAIPNKALIERLPHFLVHLDGEAVEPVRPVQHEAGNPVLDLEVDRFVSHGRFLDRSVGKPKGIRGR